MPMPYALRETVTDPLSFGVVDILCVFNLFHNTMQHSTVMAL